MFSTHYFLRTKYVSLSCKVLDFKLAIHFNQRKLSVTILLRVRYNVCARSLFSEAIQYAQAMAACSRPRLNLMF